MYRDDIGSRPLKKPRNPKACDGCKKRKIKCDSSHYPGSRCSNCIDFDIECTYRYPTKKRGPKSKYVESLEAKLKTLLQSQSRPSRPSRPSSRASNHSIHSNPHSYRTESSSSSSSLNEPTNEWPHKELFDEFKNMQANPVQERFFGFDSVLMVLRNIMGSGSKPSSKPSSKQPSRSPSDSPSGPPLAIGSSPTPPFHPQSHTGSPIGGPPNRRPQYWYEPPWEWHTGYTEQFTSPYVFPSPHLLSILVSMYFARVHPQYPILHEGAFMRMLNSGKHYEDRGFGGVVLMVCAVAAPYVGAEGDLDILLGVEGGLEAVGRYGELSCGWQWYEQVRILRKNFLSSATVFELQTCCLTALYLLATSSPHGSLYVVNVGLRFAEDMGLHKRKVEGAPFTAEDELLKRNFWILLVFERILCSIQGRSILFRERDIDTEMPIEVDDVYWEVPEEPSQGPLMFTTANGNPTTTMMNGTSRPSTLAMFSCQITLCRILSKAKKIKGDGQEKDVEVLAAINKSLHEWLDAVPEHLRWTSAGATTNDPIFFKQTIALGALFCFVQIQVHKLFLSSSPASVIVCVTAAREGSTLLDMGIKAGNWWVGMGTIPGAFVFAAVLAQIMKERKNEEYSLNMESIHLATRVLDVVEKRWTSAGRLRDTLKVIVAQMQSKTGLPQQQQQHSPLLPPIASSHHPQIAPQMQIDQEHSLYQMVAFYSHNN